jgi:hypothetical protein
MCEASAVWRDHYAVMQELIESAAALGNSQIVISE